MRNSLRLVLVLAALCAAALAWDWWQQRGPQGEAPAPAVAVVTPEIDALISREKPLTVIHAWATWCPPCMVEMPGLLEALRHPPANVEVVMVSLDAEPGKVETFYIENGINPADERGARWLHDPSGTLVRGFEPEVKLPLTVVYTRGGSVLQTVRGAVAWPSFLNTLQSVKM